MATSANRNLHQAKKAKKDEFYTQLVDIENELKHYKAHFEGKVIYCNCDDPKVSNFFLYFAKNFWHLKLKKLICSCYQNNDAEHFSLGQSDKGCFLEYNGVDQNGKELREVTQVETFIPKIKSTAFKGDGDFRSVESIALLKQADIVVTNPPFSLFREYVAQLVEYDKKFVIIGHQNATSYKEIFKLIKEDKIWLGMGFRGGAGHFINVHYEDYATAGDHREGMIRVSGVNWFTNLDIKKRHEILETIHSYAKTPEKYPKYDNYDAINVDKTNEIPMDYDGVMGVPITFLDKYNPEQFEIVGLSASAGYDREIVGIDFLGDKDARPLIVNKVKFARVFIQKRKDKK